MNEEPTEEEEVLDMLTAAVAELQIKVQALTDAMKALTVPFADEAALDILKDNGLLE